MRIFAIQGIAVNVCFFLFPNTLLTLHTHPYTTLASQIGYYQKQNTNLKNGVNNAALIGSIFGQLFFGFAGDLCGRKWNFVITSMLLIIGALGTATASAGQTVPCGSGVGSTYAVNTGSGAYYPNAQIPTVTAYPLASGMCSDGSSLPTGSFNDVYMQLNIWRGLLGFGVGGEYPLASTITSESTSNLVSRGVAVLSIFSMQGWGKLSAAIVNYACIATTLTFGGGWVIDAVWRFSMAFGCALNLITLFFRWHMHESKIYGDRHHMETTGEVSKDDDIPTLDSGIMAIAATSEPNSPVVDAAEPVKGTNTTKATDMVITKHDGNIAMDMKPLDGWTSVRVISECACERGRASHPLSTRKSMHLLHAFFSPPPPLQTGGPSSERQRRGSLST